MSFFQNIFILFIICTFSFAQSNVSLHGTVHDSLTGTILQGAEVFFTSNHKGAVSNAQGHFTIEQMDPGTYRINVHYIGYRTYTKNISVTSSQNFLAINLQPQVRSTTEIIVSGRKDSGLQLMLPARTDQIELAEIAPSNQRTADQLLGEHSTAFIKSYGSAGQLQTISIRGMSAEQTQVLLDGIPLNGMQLGSVDLGQFHTSNLSAAEVYYGGSPLFGGSGAIGGAVNLKTIQPTREAGYSAYISLASFHNSDVSFSADLPMGSFRQRLHIAHQVGKNDYTATYLDSTVRLKNRDYNRLNLSYQTAYDLNSNWSFLSYLSWFQNEAGAASGFINPLTEKTNKARSENENILAKMELLYHGASGELEMRSWIRDETMRYEDSTLVINNQSLNSRHRNREWAGQLNGRYLIANDLLLLAGAEFSLQDINSTEAGVHKRRHIATYLMQNWQMFDSNLLQQKLYLQLKMRWEYDSVYGSIFLPGVGLQYEIADLNFYSSIGKNYRSPSFNDLYWVPGGNPDLKPEQSTNFELGASYKKEIMGNLFSIASTFYQNKVENQIKWLPENNLWRPQNILEVRSRGLEVDVNLSDPRKIHQVAFVYNRQQVIKIAPEFKGDQTDGNQLPFIPQEQWKLKVQSGFSDWKAGIVANAMSFRYKNLQNEAAQVLSANTIWRFWTQYKFNLYKHELLISTSVENLFNADYEIMTGYPMPPRNYRGVVSIKF